MTAALYRLDRVVQQYATTVAVCIDTLDIPEGACLALVGPTGAGKSTLLRLLAGLETAQAGAIFFRGQPFDTIPPPERRTITLVFQRPLLLHASVRANIEWGLRQQRVPDRQLRVEAILGALRLEKLAGRQATQLSGGEMQLVALARALVLEPQVLLLDEPTAHLDPARVALVEAVLRQRRAAMTVVLATHNLFQARRLAESVGLLLDGHLIEVAPTTTFFASPSDPRTRAFVQGEMVY